MLCDLDCLHAGTETHGSVGLRKTTSHATGDTSEEVRRAERLGVVLGLGRDEEENGTLGGGFDPGPWDKTLVDCSQLCQRAAPSISSTSNSQPATPPRPQMRVMAPDMPSDLLAAMVVFTTSKGYSRHSQLLHSPALYLRSVMWVFIDGYRTWPRVVTSNKLRPAPTARTLAVDTPTQSPRLTQQVAELDRLLLELGRPVCRHGGHAGGRCGAHLWGSLIEGMGRTKAEGCFAAKVSV